MLADGKMPVVAGNRTEKFYLIQAAPRLWRAVYTVEHRPSDGVIHHIQAGITADNHIFRRHIQKIPHQLFGLRDSIQTAVVAAVGPVRGGQIALAAQNVHHRGRKNQLIGARFPPGHIQLLPFAFVLFIFLHITVFQCRQSSRRKLGIRPIRLSASQMIDCQKYCNIFHIMHEEHHLNSNYSHIILYIMK